MESFEKSKGEENRYEFGYHRLGQEEVVEAAGARRLDEIAGDLEKIEENKRALGEKMGEVARRLSRGELKVEQWEKISVIFAEGMRKLNEKEEQEKRERSDLKLAEVKSWIGLKEGASAEECRDAIEEYGKKLEQSISNLEVEQKQIEERAKYNPELQKELEELKGDLGSMKEKKVLLDEVIGGLVVESGAEEAAKKDESPVTETEDGGDEEPVINEEKNDDEPKKVFKVVPKKVIRNETEVVRAPIKVVPRKVNATENVFSEIDHGGGEIEPRPLGEEEKLGVEEERERGFEKVLYDEDDGGVEVEPITSEDEGAKIQEFEDISSFSPEARAKLEAEVKEKIKKSGRLRKVKALLLAGVIMVSVLLGGCSPKKANNKQESQIQAVVNLDEEEEGVTLEDFGETDDRQEATNGTKYNYDDYASRLSREEYESGKYTKEQLDAMGKKLSYNAFGTNSERFFNDREGAVQDILDACKNAPEILAAHVSYFPEILAKCGLEGKNANEIDELLSDKDGGGALQAELVEAYTDMLRDEGTKFDFYYEDDSERTYYMYYIDEDGDGKMSPNEIHLAQSISARKHAPQVRIVSKSGEAIDLNMRCRYQPNQDTEIVGVKTIKTKIIEDETTETPVVVKETSSEATPVVQDEDEPATEETSPIVQDEDETATEETSTDEIEEIKKKDGENQKRLDEQFENEDEAKAKTAQTESEDLNEVTEMPKQQGGNEQAENGASATGDYSEEEAKKRQEGQEAANRDELPPNPNMDEGGDEFDAFMKLFSEQKGEKK